MTPDTFPWLQELGKAVLLVSGLLVSCLIAGALFSVVINWPAHWEAWKARRASRMPARWFRSRAYLESRVSYQSPVIRFPIRKED